MVWSNSIPDPLIVGGNGVIGAIELYNAQGQRVGYWVPSEFVVINPANGAEISIQPADFVYGAWPTIYFKTSPNSQVAFINATSDSSGNPQLSINSTPYTDPVGGETVYQRLSMADNALSLQIVKSSDQSEVSGLQITDNGLSSTQVFSKRGAVWTVFTFQNGWGWFGNPYWGPSALALPDGRTMLRGLFQAGTTTANTVIANIPAADAAGNKLRPTAGSGTNGRLVFLTAGDAGSGKSPDFDNKIYIDTNGNITIPSAFSGGTMSIDGISYQSYL